MLLDPIAMGLHLDAALTVPSRPSRSKRGWLRKLEEGGCVRLGVLVGRSWKHFPLIQSITPNPNGSGGSIGGIYGNQVSLTMTILNNTNTTELLKIRNSISHLRGVAEALLVARCKDGLLRNMEQLATHVATLEVERQEAVSMRNKIERWLIQVETGQNPTDDTGNSDSQHKHYSTTTTSTTTGGGDTITTPLDNDDKALLLAQLHKQHSSDRIRSRLATGKCYYYYYYY